MEGTQRRSQSWWRRRAPETRSLTKSNVPSVFFAAGPGETAVTPSNALTIADAYACVRALADAAASLPLIVYRRTNGSTRDRVENATAELLRNPAPAVTQAGLIGTVVAHLNTHGNAFVGKYRDAAGQVAQLGCLPPSAMTVELKGGRPVYT
jgi:phage portal protein BeeE